LQGNCKEIARKLQGNCKEIARKLQGNCKEIARKLQGNCKEIIGNLRSELTLEKGMTFENFYHAHRLKTVGARSSAQLPWILKSQLYHHCIQETEQQTDF